MRILLLFTLVTGLFASSLFDIFLPSHELQTALWFDSTPNTLSQLQDKNYQKEKNARIIGEMQSVLQTKPDATWIFGYFKESRTRFDANPNLVTLLAQDSIKAYQLQQDGTLLPLNGKGQIYLIEGAFLKRTFQTKNTTGFVSVKCINGLEYFDLDIKGEAKREAGETDFGLDLVHRYYQKNLLTKNKIYREFSPDALGYGVDVGISYRFEDFYIATGVRNITSKMVWKNLIDYSANVNSQTIYRGKDGYNHARPMVQGKYQPKQTLQNRLPKDRYFIAQTHYKNTVLSVEYFDLDSVEVYSTQFLYQNIEVAYTSKLHTLSFGYRDERFFLSLSTDFLNYDHSNQLQLSLGENF